MNGKTAKLIRKYTTENSGLDGSKLKKGYRVTKGLYLKTKAPARFALKQIMREAI